MDLQQTISNLNRLVVWGYNQNRINGKLLTGFQDVVKQLVEIEEQERIGRDLSEQPELISAKVVSELTTLRFIATNTGLTPKAIQKITELDDDFLDWYARNGQPIHSDLDFMAMLSVKRGIDACVEIDIRNIRYYQSLMQKVTPDNATKMKPYLLFLRDMCPHLSHAFAQVDNGSIEMDWDRLNETLYQYHLNSKND